jgi:hypothetical protein
VETPQDRRNAQQPGFAAARSAAIEQLSGTRIQGKGLRPGWSKIKVKID